MVLAGESLSSSVRANLSIIQAGVNRGLTSRAINASIIASRGVGVNRSELLRGMRHAKGVVESKTRVRNMRKDRRPDPRRIRQASSGARGRMRTQYAYEVKYSGLSRTSGEREDTYIWIREDNLLSPEEIERMAAEILDTVQEDTQTDEYQGGRAPLMTVIIRRD